VGLCNLSLWKMAVTPTDSCHSMYYLHVLYHYDPVE
jgi:hypothetical protein